MGQREKIMIDSRWRKIAREANIQAE